MASSLPDSAPKVKVYALPTGRLHLPERWLFEDGDDDVRRKREDSPVFSFLIEHPSGRRVLFDLGLRKVRRLAFSVICNLLDLFSEPCDNLGP